MKATCKQCGGTFEATRSTQFCGPTCRKRSSRAAKADPGLAPVTPLDTADEPGEPALVVQIRKELDDAGKLDTFVGQLALQLAGKVCSDRDTGSAKAAASKELRAVMAEALADVTKKADSLDELAARRLQKASGA